MLAAWRYHNRNSFMDRLDPRTRWIFSLSFLFSSTLFWDARFQIGFFILAIIWYTLGGTTFKETKRSWLLISILLFMMIFINTIVTGGGAGGVVPEGGHLALPFGFTIPIINQYVAFGLTAERLWFAICQIMRIGGISAIFIIIPYTMDPRCYGITFRRLGLPDRFAYTMELSFRFLPTLTREFAMTLDAQKARGYEIERVKGGIFKQIVRVAPLIIPVTMNAILASEDIANAMDLRCFGIQKRTWLYELHYQWIDYAVLILSVLMLIGSLIAVYMFKLGGFITPQFFINWFISA